MSDHQHSPEKYVLSISNKSIVYQHDTVHWKHIFRRNILHKMFRGTI